jgi:4-amino-4-deoxy-L-arabinose transferase-like glycosyltransferase
VSSRARLLLIEGGIALALSAVALAVRLPQLQEVPAFTDETAEISGAVAILEDGQRPMVDPDDAYRGPLWSYTLAAAFAAFGLNPAVPRAVVALFGALTVGVTYLLGRIVSGRVAGLVAAALMATAFSHIVLNSHVAWSNAITPFWATLAVALVALGVGRDRAEARGVTGVLICAGVAWGLALQTHPSVVPLLVGVALWFLLSADGRARLRSPGPWLAVAAFLVVLSPVLLYNVRHDVVSIRAAIDPANPVATAGGPWPVASRLVQLWLQLGVMAAGGPVDLGRAGADALVRLTDALQPAVILLYAGLIAGALAFAALRGPRLVAVAALGAMLLVAVFNRSYLNFYDSRYFTYLLPLAYTCLGVMLARLVIRDPRWRVPLLAAVGLMVVYPLLPLWAYYERQTGSGATNRPLHDVVELLVEQANGPGDYIFVDKALRDIALGGGGNTARAYDHLLTLYQVRHQLSDVDELRWFLQHDADTSFIIIAAQATWRALAGEMDLQVREQGAGWVVLERRGRAGP